MNSIIARISEETDEGFLKSDNYLIQVNIFRIKDDKKDIDNNILTFWSRERLHNP